MTVLRVIELFAGIGSQATALRNLGIPFKSIVCEIDPHAYNAYCAVHGPTENLGDITKVEHLPECDLITYSFPCLTGNTLVQTSEGWKEIRSITKGDMVYTDDGYRKVTDWAMTGIKPVMTVKAMSGLPIECTEYHPFLVRRMSRVWNNENRSYDRVFSEPEYIQAKDLTKDCYLGFPIPKSDMIPEWNGICCEWSDGRAPRRKNELGALMEKPDFWYTVGRYIADGWTRTQGGIVIAFGNGKWEQAERMPFHYNKDIVGNVMKAHIPLSELEAFCRQFGEGALNKHIPTIYKTIPKHLAEAMLEGYMDGDGNITKGGYNMTTVSRRLALDLVQLIAYVYDRPASIYYSKRMPKHVIEGRTVNQHDTYNVRFHKDKRIQDKAFYEDGWIWSPVETLTDISEEEVPVYDITVEDRHCFVAEGVLVKNCQDLSLAGKRKGMAEGSGTRSSLLWEVERLLRDMKDRNVLPEVLLMENVDAILHKANKPHFERFITQLSEMGYISSYAVLNAKDYGIPQNRRRCFMVSTLHKGQFIFPQGEELKLRLKDMLESDVPESYFLSEERIARYERHRIRQEENGRGFGWKPLDPDKEKSCNAVTSTPIRHASGVFVTEKPCSDTDTEKIQVVGDLHTPGQLESANRVYSPEGILPTLLTSQGGGIVRKIEVAGDLHESGRLEQHNRVYDADGVAPTLYTTHGGDKSPKIEIAGKMGGTDFGQSARVCGIDGISPSVLARDWKEPTKIDVSEIRTFVRVRKNEIDQKALASYLRDAKKKVRLSNKAISKTLGRPQTEVEHWFRTDDCGCVPDPEIWMQLKKVLQLTDDTYDQAVMEFIEKENEYEKSQRLYGIAGIAPTITNRTDIKIQIKGHLGGGRITEHYAVYDSNGLSPTLAACDSKDPTKIEVPRDE